MEEKNLPIKFFQKRLKDEMDTEGGGERKLPKWALSADEVREKTIYISLVLSNVSSSLSEKVKQDNYIPSVVKIKLNEDALAKSYRREIANLFNTTKLNLIGIDRNDEVLIKIDSEVDLTEITRKLNNSNAAYPSYSTIVGISAITDISEFKPAITTDFNSGKVLKVKLFNYEDFELNSILIKNFETYCFKNNLLFERGTYSSDLIIYRISEVTKDSFDELKTFDGIQLISEMPIFDLTTDEISDSNTIPVKSPSEEEIYPIVGVLDTGIANIPHLSPWIIDKKFTKYHEDDIDKSHGTFVSGVILYGDELEETNHTGLEGCKLFEAVVFPNDKKLTIHEDELIENIREAISENNEIKIWNLSLGLKVEADTHEFSDFAKALDEIQEIHNVLICKSAGNCTNYTHGGPKSRISKSADSIRAIVVGSIAHDKNSTDFAEINNPSPFSRIGPGPSNIIKPDVVHFGGNSGLDYRNRQIDNPVFSFSKDGNLSKQVGTSFSTPRISAIAAGLSSLINEEFNPLLIKALIIHSARYPEEMKMKISDKLNSAGFGLPPNINEILFNQPNEITLILQDTIEKGNFIDILDFPFPQSMVDEDGYFYGEVTVTLVTSPILEPSQGGEYCQSNIDIMFGSYDQKKERDTTKPTIKNPIGADGRQNVLSTSVYSKRAYNDESSAFANERMLVSYGDKFQPVKKWCVNFDEFTPANKEKYLKSPKNWYLKIEGLFRHFTESKCEIQKTTPSQEFCLIITIKDTKRKGFIYNEVTQLLDNLSFVHSNVRIRDEVRVRLNQ